MSIYTQIRKAAHDRGVLVDDESVYRIAGTLKVAGAIAGDALLDVIQMELDRLTNEATQPPAPRQAQDPEVEEIATLKEIDAGIAKGTCPRCRQGTRDVKLADYTPARYCSACGITLWSEDSDEA